MKPHPPEPMPMETDPDTCDHYWIVRLLLNGEPDYRVGVHGIRTPAVHATCQKCNARAYFTEEQLSQMPVRSEL